MSISYFHGFICVWLKTVVKPSPIYIAIKKNQEPSTLMSVIEEDIGDNKEKIILFPYYHTISLRCASRFFFFLMV